MELVLIICGLAFAAFVVANIHTTDRRRWSHGAVTVVYECPLVVQGGSVAPTAAQDALVNELSATVQATADGDTTATITHNWGLSTAALALGHPWVILEPLLQAPALLSGWAITAKATNSITLTKSTTASSGTANPQLRVHCVRPHSLIGEFPVK